MYIRCYMHDALGTMYSVHCTVHMQRKNWTMVNQFRAGPRTKRVAVFHKDKVMKTDVKTGAS